MTQAEKDEFLTGYNEIHESLMRFCIVKSRGIMDPKDLANDVLLVGLENYSALKEKKALLSYLFTTANRICLNKLRRRKFEGHFDEKAVNKLEDTQLDQSEKVDIQFLYEALDQLPELQKEAVILFEISDLPIKEIMVIQNSGESAVKQRIKRGREKLTELLQEKERKKIALLTAIFITSQSFSMSNLNLYFQAVKSLPLPLSNSQAAATITNFTATGTAVHATAAKLGTTLLKKLGLGFFVATVAISTTLILMSPSKGNPPEKEAIVFSDVKMTDDQKKVSENEKLKDFTITQSGISSTVLDPSLDNNQLNLSTNSLKTSKKTEDLTCYDAVDDDTKNAAPALKMNDTPTHGIEKIVIDNLGDHVKLKFWDKNEIQVIANHEIVAKTPEDEEFIRSRLTHKIEQKGQIIFISQSNCNMKRSVSAFGRNFSRTIEFDNNEKIKYKEITTYYTVILPRSVDLELKGYYDSFIAPDINANLTTNLFETHFSCGSVSGNADLAFHYCKVSMGDLQNVKLEAFQSSVTLHNTDLLSIQAKYGKLTVNNAQLSKLELFETQFAAASATGTMNADLKYSTFSISKTDFAASKITAFQSKIAVPTFADLELAASYSTLSIQEIGNLTLTKAFESKFTIGTVSSIIGQSSKYSTYAIVELKGAIELESFEDRLTISKSNNAAMQFNGKYSTYSIALAPKADYQFKFDGNYVQLDYAVHPLKINQTKKENEHQIINGYFYSADENSAIISFDCFESRITLH